jgi:hypothetical protein
VQRLEVQAGAEGPEVGEGGKGASQAMGSLSTCTSGARKPLQVLGLKKHGPRSL